MDIGKLFIVFGLFFVLLGVGWSLGLGRLPGDIIVRRGNATLFIPIVSSIILSIFLTLMINWFFNRR